MPRRREESAFIEPYGQGGGYWDVAYADRITDGRGDDRVISDCHFR